MPCLQIGNLQALAQFLSNASKSLSGTLADILSPSRMIIFGTLLTTLNKPMFAASGYIYATFGTVITLYWVTAGVQLCFVVPATSNLLCSCIFPELLYQHPLESPWVWSSRLA